MTLKLYWFGLILAWHHYSGIRMPFVQSTDPDVAITLNNLVQSHGFRLETYLVNTSDGYILTVQRVIDPSLPATTKLKPVILQHGLFETGIDFFVSSPFLYSKINNSNISPGSGYLGDNLGFDLALIKRYEVWVANARGVMQTVNQHVNLTTADPQFWAYSWDEMGVYDLPAVIDFVLAKTGRATVGYVGFSEGSTSLLVTLSLKPEYSEKVEPAIFLAPIAYLDNMISPIRFLNPNILGLCGFNSQFIVSHRVFDFLLSRFCPLDFTRLICPNVMFVVSGFDPQNLNATRLPVYYSHFPAPGSNRQICHYFQVYKTKRFARYDYGSEHANMIHYRQPKPPDYPLEKIGKITMAFFIGRNDYFSRVSDVDHLRASLNKSQATVLPNFIIEQPWWSHLSFVFGAGAGMLVFNDVIKVLDKYMLAN